ncbi:MAG: LysM peptidoglycan-binding domain-containing protein [Bacteroidetes bacterium]|nr:LysM peptidoglycan-binding domain-containing protein [Bacteroidota bacterium]
MKSTVFTIFFSFLFFIAANSQDVKKSKKIEKIDGKEFYIHVVQKNETVWKIAKAYKVTPDDIYSVNKDAENKIKTGQEIKIPLNKKKSDNTKIKKNKETPPIKKDKDSPPIKKDKDITTITIKKDTVALNNISPKLQDSYNIALLIPLYLNNIYQIAPDDPDIKEKDASDFLSLQFLQFYEGMLMAVDSIKKKGLSANIYVYDVNDDTLNTMKIIEKPEFSKMHLIIGPFYKNSLKIVSKYAKNKKIKIVDPVSANDSVLIGNQYVFKATLSVDMQLKQLAEYILDRYPSSPVVIVHNNKENEKRYVEFFEKSLSSELKKLGRIDTNYHEVVYNQSGTSGIVKFFNHTDTNIVVTFSNGEIFVTNYINNLNNIYNNYKMVIFGLLSWKNFDNIETEYMQNISLHLYSSSFVDYTDSNVKTFISKFREIYKTEPDKYAFQGFDIAMYFFNALKDYGLNFEKDIDKIKGTYLQNNYKFIKTGEYDGYENSFLNIYRYEDYNFIDVREHPQIKEKEIK